MKIASTPLEGVVLADGSLKTLAIDRGAVSIFASTRDGPRHPDETSLLPPLKDIVWALQSHGRSEWDGLSITCRIGEDSYCCKVFVLSPDLPASSPSEAMLLLHIRRKPESAESVLRVAEEYGLSRRERQTLQGVARGQNPKEIACELDISPNTVKVYLKLIMTKLGVTSRGGIVRILLEAQL